MLGVCLGSSLQISMLVLPVVALAFHQASAGRLLLLAGEGPFLKVFDVDSSELLGQYQVFNDQAVHGIVVSDEVTKDEDLQAAIWGGSSLVLLSKAKLEELLLQETCDISDRDIELRMSDWVISVALDPWRRASCAAVNAHNTVQRVDLQNGISHVRQVVSPSRSILYSAHIVWEGAAETLVAAGTVFGEIIVWRASLTEPSYHSQVLFTFTGHEGSVFGVNISPKFNDLDRKDRRVLVSCSDDRTIRVWDIAGHASLMSGIVECEPTNAMLRETGFGENKETRPETKTDECMAVVVGHASRIWGVKVRIASDSTVNILSFGEDSTTQQWLLGQSQEPGRPYRLQHMQTFAFHTGKHLWAAAMRYKAKDRVLLATGGSDGKIAVYEVASANINSLKAMADIDDSAQVTPIACSWSFDEFSQSLAVQSTSGKDGFNRYAFISEDHVVMTTTSGRVLHGIVGAEIDWHELKLPESHEHDLKSYSIIKASQVMKTAFLAASNGNIFSYYHTNTEVQLLACVGQKVVDIFTTWVHGVIRLVVIGLRGQMLEVFELHLNDLDHVTVKRRSRYRLPNNFIVTSVGCVEGTAIFGSRQGLLATCDPRSDEASLNVSSMVSTSKEAITSITAVPNLMPDASTKSAYFLTTSRDGTYSIYCYIDHNDCGETHHISFQRVHQGKPPFGPMIEAAWFHDMDLILLGFKSKNLIVWNETQESEILSVECGGAHRSFAYTSFANSNGGSLIFTKASRLYLHSQRQASHRIVKRGGHGREIKACAMSSDRKLFATGAEDTNIRIWTYVEHQQAIKRDFKCLTTIQMHSAGVQHLQWYKSHYLFSSGGNEEFYIWAVHDIPGFGIGVVCEASCPDQSKEHDLRITSFDVSKLPASTGVTNEPRLLISLVYSDSTLRTYTYWRTRGFCLVAEAKYTNICLTQIHHLSVTPRRILLLTGGTDGKLLLWQCSLSDPGDPASDVTSTRLHHQLISAIAIHQNTIKCISTDNTFLPRFHSIALGGDDNALSIVIIDVNNPSTAPRIIQLKSAHAAAITGLCFVPSCTDKAVQDSRRSIWRSRLVSSGNDQRVKEWDVEVVIDEVSEECYQVEELRLSKRSDNVSTTVADVAAVGVLRDGGGEGQQARAKVLLVGNGMEAFAVDR